MTAAFVLLRCIGKAVIKNGVKSVVNLFSFGVGGDILVDAWEYWREASKEEQRPADVQALAAATPAAVAAAAAEIARQEGASLSEAEKQAVTDYLTQVPAMIRRSMRRPADPEGKTIRPGATFRKPDDLLPLLPPQTPRFKPGDRPLSGVDWELVELLGRGGFGEVWKAKNPHFDGVAPVALKFCLDPAAKERLLRHEAGILNQVMRQGRHDGIVPLLHTYLSADPPCLAYEYIAGGDLTGLIQEQAQAGGMGPAQAARIIHRLAEIVGFAHDQNPAIVHRDLKPANILVQAGPGGLWALKIADFGIGGLAIQHARDEAPHFSRSTFLTRAVLGSYTLLYASPQQMAGDGADPRDDVFALGVIWHQLLTADLTKGRPGGEAWKKRLERQGMTAALLALLTSTFEEERDDRPAHAGVLAADLARLLGQAPSPLPTPSVSSTPQRFVPPVEAVPASQVVSADLPPLPKDILELEGRLTHLAQAIESIEKGRAPNLSAAWKELQGRQAADGSSVIEMLKREIESNPSRGAADLCALAPDAPQATVLTVIAAFKQLVELKKERAQVEVRLCARQEEDFLGVLRHWFEASKAADFPLTEWMKLEPQFALRRYRFVTSGRDLLKRAEEFWQSAGGEKQAWRAAEKAGTAEACEAYLAQHASGPHAEEAKQKAASLLRALTWKPADRDVRRRYLRVRTPELRARDGSVFGLRALFQVIFIVLLGTGSILLGGAIAVVMGGWWGSLVGAAIGGTANAVGLLLVVACVAEGPPVATDLVIFGVIILVCGLVGSLTGCGLHYFMPGPHGDASLGACLGSLAPSFLLMLVGLYFTLRDMRAGEPAPPEAKWSLGYCIGLAVGGGCGIVGAATTIGAGPTLVACGVLGGACGLLISFLFLLRATAQASGEVGPLPWWETISVETAKKRYLK